jgi:hypothetical protein
MTNKTTPGRLASGVLSINDHDLALHPVVHEAKIWIPTRFRKGVRAGFSGMEVFAEDLEVLVGPVPRDARGQVPTGVLIEPSYGVAYLDRNPRRVERVTVFRDHDVEDSRLLALGRGQRPQPDHGDDKSCGNPP